MKRKVIKLAQQTLVVSLPAAWCKANNVRKGDEVTCDERRASVVISKAAARNKTSTHFDGDAFGVLVKRTLNELYHAGVDRVTIAATKPQTVKSVTDTLNQLLGYHIVEQHRGSIVIEDLGKSEQDLDVLFRRFLLLIKTMLDDGIRAVQMKQSHELPSIAARDLDVNKLAHLCIRALAKNPHLAPDYASRMHTLIYQTEQLGDDVKVILHELEANPSAYASLSNALESAARLYHHSYQFLFQRTLSNAQAVARANEQAVKAVQQVALRNGNQRATVRLNSFIKKAVSIQELFLHDVQDVHHDPA